MARLSARVFARNVAVLSVLAVAVVACTVVVDEGPAPRPPRPEGPQFCTREYNPVCAVRGRDRQTFANPCMAEAAGFRIVGGGSCSADGGWEDEGPRFCTREYRPVCGRRGGQLRTFPNACEADSAGFRVIDQGQC